MNWSTEKDGCQVSVCVLVWGEGENSSGSKEKQAGNPQAN